jgi:N6-adenosine-specific RNA methylase IME4
MPNHHQAGHMTDDYDAQDDLAKSLAVGYGAIRERTASGGEPWTPKAPDPFPGLPRGHYGAILADPPWVFECLWGGRPNKTPAGVPSRAIERHYDLQDDDEIAALPVEQLAAPDCVLFMWTCWPVLFRSRAIIDAWGFTYKTCAFSWMKGDPYRLFALQEDLRMGLGYWTRANTEPCLLATRGKPKRVNTDVRQAILEPIREHSRKPDCVHERIERLVAGPYLELFARQSRPGWATWGNEATKFDKVSTNAAGL